VTRFQNRDERVVYEIAQVKLIVTNKVTHSHDVDAGNIVVYADEKAR